MRPIVYSLFLVATLGMAHMAAAQPAATNDAAAADYCRTLAKTYLSQNPVQQAPSVADATLADGCTSDARGTTAVLERKLADHKINLPKRPSVASGDGTDRPMQSLH